MQQKNGALEEAQVDPQDVICRRLIRKVNEVIEYIPSKTKQKKPKKLKNGIRTVLQRGMQEKVPFERMLLLMFFELRNLVNSYLYSSEREDKQNVFQQAAILGLREELYDLNAVWILYSIDLWIQLQCAKEKITAVEILQEFIRGVADRMIHYGNYAENDFGGMLYLTSVFSGEDGEKGRRRKYRNQIERSFSENPNIIDFIFRFSLRELSKDYKKLIRIKYVEGLENNSWKDLLKSLRDDENVTLSVQTTKEIKGFIGKTLEETKSAYSTYVEFKKTSTLRNLLRAGYADWREVLKKKNRALLPFSAGGEIILLENAMGICMFYEVMIYQDGSDVHIHAKVDFFGADFEVKIKLDEYGDLRGEDLSTIDQTILRHVVIATYKKIVVRGSDEQYEKNLQELRKHARNREEVDSAIYLPAYLRKRPHGIIPSEQNYEHAEKAGYSREWMDGENPDKELKQFMNTEAHPKKAEEKPDLYKEEILHVYSLADVLKTAKEYKE